MHTLCAVFHLAGELLPIRICRQSPRRLYLCRLCKTGLLRALCSSSHKSRCALLYEPFLQESRQGKDKSSQILQHYHQRIHNNTHSYSHEQNGDVHRQLRTHKAETVHKLVHGASCTDLCNGDNQAVQVRYAVCKALLNNVHYYVCYPLFLTHRSYYRKIQHQDVQLGIS